MKTLHLTNSWHSSSGGVSTFYRALMDAANCLHREVVLVVPGTEHRMDRYGEHCRIYSIKSPASPFDRSYRCILPRQWPRLVGILRDEEPDVVEVCDKYSLHYVGGMLRVGWLPEVRKRPTVVGLSCERLDENIAAYVWRGNMSRVFCRAYMKWLYFPLADHHIAVTAHTASELCDASRGHKVRRGVWVAPMGVDSRTFSPERRSDDSREALRRDTGTPNDSVLALYVGRLAPEKNLLLLIEMMMEIQRLGRSDLHLIVAGDGPMRGVLEAAARTMCQGRVHFLGHVGERDRLADLYANCDVFVHPNPREPFGIAPLEAMASGLPLVAPETGGVRTYANRANAWLAPDDPRAYAQATIHAALFGATHDRVTNALKAARQYSWPEVCRRYFRLYDEIHEYRLTGRNTSVPAAFHSTHGTLLGVETREPATGEAATG